MAVEKRSAVRRAVEGAAESSVHALLELSDKISDSTAFMRSALEEAIPDKRKRREIIDVYKRSLKTAKETKSLAKEPFVRRQFDSERLLELLSKELIINPGRFKIPRELVGLAEELSKGKNVVIAANHISGADPLAVFALLGMIDPKLRNRMVFIAQKPTEGEYSNAAAAFANGVDRIQVHTDMQFTQALDRNGSPDQKQIEKMRANNFRAVMEVRKRARGGGMLLVVFPQGRVAASGKLEPAPNSSSQIFEAVAEVSQVGAILVPVYIEGTQSITREQELIQGKLGKPTRIKVTAGSKVDLKEIVGEAGVYVPRTGASADPSEEWLWAQPEIIRRGMVVDGVMREIARLAPVEALEPYPSLRNELHGKP